MASPKLSYQKIRSVIFILFLLFIFSPNTGFSQNNSERIVLTKRAIENYLVGLRSENYGIKLSCLYFAGKYKLSEVSEELLEVVKNSNDDNLCEMAIWSLYQIGDDYCCNELAVLIENHSSEKIKDFCKYLNNIRQYELARNIN